MIYAGRYDYCYSRFSLHAINEEQENNMIKDVYTVLKWNIPVKPEALRYLAMMIHLLLE